MRTLITKAKRLLRSTLDPRPWLHLVRLVHYYNYAHVSQVRLASIGRDVALAPNVSFRNGQRVSIGDGAHVGAHCSLWAGNGSGSIVLGEKALLGPEVFLSASNYQTRPGVPPVDQVRDEADIHVGAGTWLGAKVVVVAGVTIGDGCIVGAGSVVTRDLPPNSIAVGAPARVVAERR